MRRFFIEDITEGSKTASITGDELHHLKSVLRIKEGSSVVLFNGRGLEFIGEVTSIKRGSAEVRIIKRVKSKTESPFDITLLQCLVKGEKPELIIQKATELGIKKIIFFSTKRSVPKLKEEKQGERLKRWGRVAKEAAKQCGRSVIPEVEGITDFKSALEAGGDSLKILLWEDEKAGPLKDIIKEKGSKKAVVVYVGPEGGLLPEEARGALSKGFIPARLGPRILRAETAAIAVISILQYELGDMGSRDLLP